VTKQIIEVVPANPSVVYVPSYPPHDLLSVVPILRLPSALGFIRGWLRLGDGMGRRLGQPLQLGRWSCRH
jgi:hypothetical protein